MKFYEHHQVIGISLPDGKNIDDYSLEFDEYNRIREEIIKIKTFLSYDETILNIYQIKT